MLREDYHLLVERKAPRLTVSFAQSEEQVREAQRLRYQVFCEEMGAQINTLEPGIDRDIFDPYCEHLLVRDHDTLEVVGTYRVLNPAQARKIGSYYAETEFDLTRLSHLSDRMVEVGRSCVHPAYRNGATIALLWSGVLNYMRQHGYDYLIGCASIGMADGGHTAASIYRRLSLEHMSPIEWRVFPRNGLSLDALDSTMNAPLPPLIKGYMRLGCYVCGEPAWDPHFNTADLLVMLPMSLIDQRYARHFFER
ncbi:MAG: GNAT family N-acetyltransferase [Burkholderiales bacterium]|nr:GNAT family N-acetyltransferase [Burkholderiales bacterium]